MYTYVALQKILQHKSTIPQKAKGPKFQLVWTFCRYEVIPGSAAELDILRGQYLSSPKSPTSETRDSKAQDSPTTVQRLIGSHLGRIHPPTYISQKLNMKEADVSLESKKAGDF